MQEGRNDDDNKNEREKEGEERNRHENICLESMLWISVLETYFMGAALNFYVVRMHIAVEVRDKGNDSERKSEMGRKRQAIR